MNQNSLPCTVVIPVQPVHAVKALAVRFWEHFAPAYFGTDRPLRDIEEEILPYAGLKNLIIERDIHAVKPWLRLALNPILN